MRKTNQDRGAAQIRFAKKHTHDWVKKLPMKKDIKRERFKKKIRLVAGFDLSSDGAGQKNHQYIYQLYLSYKA